MLTHRTTCRVIYGDTDNMGVAYHANYLRWFEMGRTEMMRDLGLSYKEIEARGVYLPVAEVHCKFKAPAQYDDVLIIETVLDADIKAGVKFNYTIFSEDGAKVLARGYTKHPCLNGEGRVVRPPEFIMAVLKKTGKHAR